ncbi:hypothetical protein LOTGIDRAFT_239331 [Lottia gigantea]|uniref:S1 motif domain-containing protein n=1 Tax=Lottia gigantea TaxID=225164 RepID=V4ANG0_LOTGI|nr:hypothetical protein LOTGIDRAFT_239331 [Lottia gigantea]ESO96310.1 hypothetical protein LOTGIDRAFT_239331 [Lottia gigantea]
MEVDFPRGKGSQKRDKKATARKPVKRKREKNLFMTEKSRPKSKKRKISKVEEDDGKKHKIQGTVDTHISNKIEPFTIKSVCPGMVLLGCISEIKDYKLIITLSNNIKGVVAITEISDAYTNKLQQLADGQITEEEEVYGLSEMFEVGMIVCCKIADNKYNINKKILDLTLNPRLVHENKTAKCLKNNMLICGSVVSEEDHGYLVDIGIQQTTGFLSKKYTQTYIATMCEGDSLMVGELVWCHVEIKDEQELLSDSIHTIYLNIQPDIISKTMIEVDRPITYYNLVPGLNVTGIVKKSSEYGIVVRVGNKFCVIHSTHVNGSHEDFKEDQKIPVKILYIHPESKTVYATTLPHLLYYNGTTLDNKFNEFTVGDIVKNAVVCETSKKGIYLKLTHGITGFAQKGHLSDSTVEKISEQFPIGSKQRCRVIGFSPIDNFIMLSLKQSILNRDFIKIRDIVPGSLFKVEVKYVKDTVIGVKIGDLKGIIPALHMADVPLKTPQKLFNEGDELDCRVLSVDMKDNKVTLTNKKSLVNTTLPIVHDTSQIHKHLELEGFIVMMNDKGVLVAFYNNVKGWVPISELTEERIEHPDKVFYIGQVVRCRVINYDEESKKIILSLKKGTRQREPRKRQISVSDQFEAGKIIECRIKIKRRDVFIVEDLASSYEAVLYKSHLADFDDLCDLLWEKLQVDDVLKQVIHFSGTNKIVSFTTSVVIMVVSMKPSLLKQTENDIIPRDFSDISVVSMKPSLLKQTENDIIPRDFSDISKDMILPAVVKNIVEYGIFFTLTGGLGGLVPMKVASDNYLSYEDIVEHLHIGQSIVIRITYLDIEKKTFVGSMLTKHCFPNSVNKASLLMESYLDNKDLVYDLLSTSMSCKDIMSKMRSIPVGSVVSTVVNNLDDDGIDSTLSNGLQAHVSTDLTYGKTVMEGDKILGVVLSIDILNNRIELSLDDKVISAMKKTQTEDDVQQLNIHTTISSTILQVNPVYYLVSLRGKALGSMAYVPTKQTINSINDKELFPVHHKLNVKINSVHNENLIALVNYKLMEAQIEKFKEKFVKDKTYLSIGGCYTACIKQIHPSTMELDIEGYTGTIHCADMVDTIENNGYHPFSEYKINDKLKVRVIGFAKKKSEEKIAECVAKPSQLKGKIGKVDKSFPLKSRRNVFIKKIDKEEVCVFLSSKRMGLISKFDLSNDLTALEHVADHFKKGQGYDAEVVGCKGRRKIVLSLLDHREKTVEGETTKCFVNHIDIETNELSVSLPWKYKAIVKVNKNIENYRLGQWFWCDVLTIDKTKRTCTIKLKNSRKEKT